MLHKILSTLSADWLFIRSQAGALLLSDQTVTLKAPGLGVPDADFVGKIDRKALIKALKAVLDPTVSYDGKRTLCLSSSDGMKVRVELLDVSPPENEDGVTASETAFDFQGHTYSLDVRAIDPTMFRLDEDPQYRPNLAGVWFMSDGLTVKTDGHRLVVRYAEPHSGPDTRVPTEAARILHDDPSGARTLVCGRNLRAMLDGRIELFVLLPDHNEIWPLPFDSVIPDRNSPQATWTFDKKALKSAIARVKPFRNTKTNRLELHADGRIQAGDAEVPFPAAFPDTVSVNLSYLEDALDGLDNQGEALYFGNPLSPILFPLPENEAHMTGVHVLMPMRG